MSIVTSLKFVFEAIKSLEYMLVTDKESTAMPCSVAVPITTRLPVVVRLVASVSPSVVFPRVVSPSVTVRPAWNMAL